MINTFSSPTSTLLPSLAFAFSLITGGVQAQTSQLLSDQCKPYETTLTLRTKSDFNERVFPGKLPNNLTFPLQEASTKIKKIAGSKGVLNLEDPKIVLQLIGVLDDFFEKYLHVVDTYSYPDTQYLDPALNEPKNQAEYNKKVMSSNPPEKVFFDFISKTPPFKIQNYYDLMNMISLSNDAESKEAWKLIQSIAQGMSDSKFFSTTLGMNYLLDTRKNTLETYRVGRILERELLMQNNIILPKVFGSGDAFYPLYEKIQLFSRTLERYIVDENVDKLSLSVFLSQNGCVPEGVDVSNIDEVFIQNFKQKYANSSDVYIPDVKNYAITQVHLLRYGADVEKVLSNLEMILASQKQLDSTRSRRASYFIYTPIWKSLQDDYSSNPRLVPHKARWDTIIAGFRSQANKFAKKD